MRIINVTYDDYANFSYDNAKALQSVGVDAESFKLKAHPFGYTNQSKVIDKAEMYEEISKADLVQIMHSDTLFLSMCTKLGKKCVVYHTGSKYRNSHVGLNDFFNPHVEMCFTDQCEFVGLGGKNIRYIATAIGTENIKPSPYNKIDRTKFAHYPSNLEVKGTMDIIRMVAEVHLKYPENKFDFQVSTDKLPHAEQLARMSDCDVYIELFKLELLGNPYGCFGVTAFEAAALGKIVVTNCLHIHEYKKEYGNSPFIIVNTEHDFRNAIQTLSKYTRDEIETGQLSARSTIVDNHSYKATGYKLYNILEPLIY